MGAAVALPLIMAAAGTAGQIITRNDATKAQQKQIDIQRQQAQIAAADKSKQQAENLNQVMSSNIAASAAKGISLASPSFKAINNAAFGKFQEDDKMNSLNLAGRMAYFDAESQSLNYQAMYGMFGDIARYAETALNTITTNINKGK